MKRFAQKHPVAAYWFYIISIMACFAGAMFFGVVGIIVIDNWSASHIAFESAMLWTTLCFALTIGLSWFFVSLIEECLELFPAKANKKITCP